MEKKDKKEVFHLTVGTCLAIIVFSIIISFYYFAYYVPAFKTINSSNKECREGYTLLPSSSKEVQYAPFEQSMPVNNVFWICCKLKSKYIMECYE